MPPPLALFLWLVLLVALLRYDPAKDPKAVWALWIPVIWMVIMGSRLPAQWLGLEGVSAADAYQEGNLLDRSIYLVLILLAVCTLVSRSVRWGNLLARNFALTLFLAFALLSVTWSDFPFVSFKRWFRDLGTYLMILVVLSDPRPLEAIHTLLRRLCYLLIPLSVVLIKYYPHLGRGYSQWTGDVSYLGVTTSKNMLGALCLVSGLFFFWDTVTRWADRKERQTRRIILVNVALIGMTLWLLNLAHSATSSLCLLIGCLVIAAARSRSVRTSPGRLKVLIPSAVVAYLVLELGFNISDVIIHAVGREATLTGRTELWNDLLAMRINPLLGTGYESFWLGDRLQAIWTKHPFRPNQAHNGYLEVYLNLGLLGLCVLAGFLIASYRRICSGLTTSNFALLGLALWTILLVYNVTEAAFKSQLVWFTFLLAGIQVPLPAEAARRSCAAERSKIQEAVAT